MMKNFLILILSVLISSLVSAQKSADIRVATFNLRMDTERDSLNAWSHRKDFVNQLIRFHDFDIIGTQEGFIHQINDVLRMPEYAYTGKGRDDGKTGGEHSAIIFKKDRFKLLESGDFWLREEPTTPGKGWDATCCNRICSWAKFRDVQTGKMFYFFNVHFDHQGKVARRESAKLMAEKVHQIAKDAPVIITGDFNSEPEAEPIKIMKTHFKDSYDVTEQPPYGPTGTYNSFKFDAPMKNRIDYIFINGKIKVLKYGVLTDALYQHYPSDHQPVVAVVRLQ